MATRTNSIASAIDVSPVYHDFEPYCEWKRGEDSLVVHIPEFKKDQLSVQVNSTGVLKINGERPIEGNNSTTKSRFYKETRIPEGCNMNDIQAKLNDGKLIITMPRKSLSITPPPPPSSSSDFLVPKKPSTTDQTETRSSLPAAVEGVYQVDENEDDMIVFGRLKVAKKIAMNVGIAVMAIAAIGALLFLKPETPSPFTSSALVVNRIKDE